MAVVDEEHQSRQQCQCLSAANHSAVDENSGGLRNTFSCPHCGKTPVDNQPLSTQSDTVQITSAGDISSAPSSTTPSTSLVPLASASTSDSSMSSPSGPGGGDGKIDSAVPRYVPPLPSMNPAPEAKRRSGSALNPLAAVHAPVPRRNASFDFAEHDTGEKLDPPVRPESSISNITSNTFASQLPLPPLPFNQIYYPGMYGAADNSGQQNNTYGMANMSMAGRQFNHLPIGPPPSGPLPPLPPYAMSGGNSIAQPRSYGAPANNRMLNSANTRRLKSAHQMSGYNGGSQALVRVNPTDMDALQAVTSGATEPNPQSKPRKTEAEKWAERVSNPTMGQVRFNKQRGARAGDEDTIELPQRRAGALPRLNYARVVPPDWLLAAIQGEYKPTLDEALEHLPILELYRMESNRAHANGVLKIRNVPYTVHKSEIIAFVGQQARVLPQPAGTPYHAVHIIMERETGKTMDCYVEFESAKEANWVERSIARRNGTGRDPKIGDRTVIVEASNYEEMMGELFPRAKNVRWNGATPVVDLSRPQYYPGQPSAGYKGFLHPEELAMMAKFAENVQTSTFTSRATSRVYEALISMLHKYPWYADKYVLVSERRGIFDLCLTCVRQLIYHLRRVNTDKFKKLTLTASLLQEVVVACLTCPGFSEKQKAALAAVVREGGFTAMSEGKTATIYHGGNNRFSTIWPFQALCPAPLADIQHIEYYGKLFHDATVSLKKKSFADRHMEKTTGVEEKPYGDFDIHYGTNALSMTLADLARVELNTIETVLGRTLQHPPTSSSGSNQPPSHTVSASPRLGGGRFAGLLLGDGLRAESPFSDASSSRDEGVKLPSNRSY